MERRLALPFWKKRFQLTKNTYGPVYNHWISHFFPVSDSGVVSGFVLLLFCFVVIVFGSLHS